MWTFVGLVWFGFGFLLFVVGGFCLVWVGFAGFGFCCFVFVYGFGWFRGVGGLLLLLWFGFVVCFVVVVFHCFPDQRTTSRSIRD